MYNLVLYVANEKACCHYTPMYVTIMILVPVVVSVLLNRQRVKYRNCIVTSNSYQQGWGQMIDHTLHVLLFYYVYFPCMKYMSVNVFLMLDQVTEINQLCTLYSVLCTITAAAVAAASLIQEVRVACCHELQLRLRTKCGRFNISIRIQSHSHHDPLPSVVEILGLLLLTCFYG